MFEENPAAQSIWMHLGGHQPACLQIKVGGIMNDEYGVHRADWERVVVHIYLDKVQKVRYHQHSGSYTKHRSSVDFVDSHPVSYVGQDSHGNYHNEGGTGNCLYFQDYRRFEDPQLKVDGWKNLISPLPGVGGVTLEPTLFPRLC